MAVQVNSLGRCRVVCDQATCERKFVPRAPLNDVAETRGRAELYGWSCARPSLQVPRWSQHRHELDFCPDHVSEREVINGWGNPQEAT